MFCMCTHSCACANDAKIVRSRDAQCNSKELHQSTSTFIKKEKLVCQAFSQMGVQASCGWPLIKENHFIFHMLPYKLFI